MKKSYKKWVRVLVCSRSTSAPDSPQASSNRGECIRLRVMLPPARAVNRSLPMRRSRPLRRYAPLLGYGPFMPTVRTLPYIDQPIVFHGDLSRNPSGCETVRTSLPSTGRRSARFHGRSIPVVQKARAHLGRRRGLGFDRDAASRGPSDGRRRVE